MIVCFSCYPEHSPQTAINHRYQLFSVSGRIISVLLVFRMADRQAMSISIDKMTAQGADVDSASSAGGEIPILATKLVMPCISAETVTRQRLLEKLHTDNSVLSLICAPAGFGKTTLLTRWLDNSECSVAWLSLDEDDSDPVRFILYLIAAIRTHQSGFGISAAEALMSTNSPRLLTLLGPLLNEINTFSEPFVLALDDYHVIENNEIHELLSFIIQNKPASMHIAITSRSEPPLALPRLRVRRQVTEVTEKDLRFNDNEAEIFLNRIAGLDLSSDDVAILEARTEGWIAGLQLAALSLKDEDDRRAFIQAFAGDDRYIMDYLAEEVLHRLPEEVKNFLLKTSILERLCGPLCDHVTGSCNSTDLLDKLEQDNMFLIPIDNKRFWYRYHHLFAELLCHQLNTLIPDEIGLLHQRASEWYVENGFIPEAMHHAFAAEAFELAGQIAEKHGKTLFDQGQFAVLMGWYQRLPENYLQTNPMRLLQYAWVMFISTGDVPEGCLQTIKVMLEDACDYGLSTTEQKQIRGELAFLNGFIALQQRHMATAIESVEQALALFEEIGFTEITAPLFHLATACYATGQLKKSEHLYQRVVEDGFRDKFLIVLNGAICGLARAIHKQGELARAQSVLEAGLTRLRENGWEEILVDVTWIYIALGDIALQKNDLAEATRLYEKAIELAKNDPCPWDTLTAMACVGLAAVQRVNGESEMLEQSLHYVSTLNIRPALLPLFPSVDALMVRIRLLQGDTKAARHWCEQQGFAFEDDVPAEKEEEYILLARTLIQEQKPEPTLALLSPMLLLAEQGGRTDIIIEILVLMALCRQQQGNTRQALEALQRAMLDAEPAAYVRIFLDEGPPMLALLKKLIEGGHNVVYAQMLVDQFVVDSSENGRVTQGAGLIEPLSKKELQTLGLLITGMSNKEIAEHLFVSSNTVKTHVKRIYAKLDVNNRAHAIARANELKLITGSIDN